MSRLYLILLLTIQFAGCAAKHTEEPAAVERAENQDNYGSKPPNHKGSGLEPVTPAVSDPYPLTDTNRWESAGAEVYWVGKSVRGYNSWTADRNQLTDAVPEFHLRNWKLGLIESLPIPKKPFRITFDGKATDAILGDVSRLKPLEALSLSSCDRVTDAGLKSLGELTELKELDLTLTKVTGAGLAELCALKQLRSLTLLCDDIDDAGMRHLSKLKQLRYLDLSCTHVTDAGLKELSPLSDLQLLGLTRCEVTDAGLKDLRHFKNLQALFLHFTKVTDAGLKDLRALRNLHELGLNGTQVTDEGLKELSALRSLESLSLKHTKVTEAGVSGLQVSLPACEIVR